LGEELPHRLDQLRLESSHVREGENAHQLRPFPASNDDGSFLIPLLDIASTASSKGVEG